MNLSLKLASHLADQIIFIFLPYLAGTILVFGLAAQIDRWRNTPLQRPVFLAPAAKTRLIAFWGWLPETLVFAGLRRQDKWLRLVLLVFHFSLLIVFLKHLRYFLDPVPGWVQVLQGPGLLAGVTMTLALIILLIRRLSCRRVMFISTPADFFILLFFLTISLSGLAMSYFRVDLIAIKTYCQGLMKIAPEVLEEPGIFLVHFLLAMALALYLPFSKLVHGLGIFFTPTRTQTDDYLRG